MDRESKRLEPRLFRRNISSPRRFKKRILPKEVPEVAASITPCAAEKQIARNDDNIRNTTNKPVTQTHNDTQNKDTTNTREKNKRYVDGLPLLNISINSSYEEVFGKTDLQHQDQSKLIEVLRMVNRS